MAAEMYFIYRGGDEDVIPRDATHVIIHHSVTVIRATLFSGHPNIVELYCDIGVIKIERAAFCGCPRLKWVIMRSVKVIEDFVFCGCEALEDVECDKLERIGASAFYKTSLKSINLPSAVIVRVNAFLDCEALKEVKFGKHLESIEGEAFENCRSLEGITIPLKKDLIPGGDDDGIFHRCWELRHVDLVEAEVLRETINALLLDERRKHVMSRAIDLINRTLIKAGHLNGGKTRAVRWWSSRVLRKIIDYKAQHRSLVNEVATTLELRLPNDVVMNNVIPFFDLPSHTFHGEDCEEEVEEDNSSEDASYYLYYPSEWSFSSEEEDDDNDATSDGEDEDDDYDASSDGEDEDDDNDASSDGKEYDDEEDNCGARKRRRMTNITKMGEQRND